MIIKCCTLWTVFLWSFQVRALKCQIFTVYELASCLSSNVMRMGLDMWWLSWCNSVKFPGRPSWHCYLKTWWLLSLREIKLRQLHFKSGNLYICHVLILYTCLAHSYSATSIQSNSLTYPCQQSSVSQNFPTLFIAIKTLSLHWTYSCRRAIH